MQNCYQASDKKIVNVNQNIFIDPFMIIAYNIDEQDYLLDLSALLLWVQTFNLSASQLKMRIVNIQGDKLLISLFCYTMEDKI